MSLGPEWNPVLYVLAAAACFIGLWLHSPPAAVCAVLFAFWLLVVYFVLVLA